MDVYPVRGTVQFGRYLRHFTGICWPYLWVLYIEYRRNRFLRNVCRYLLDCTASHLKKTTLKIIQLKHRISFFLRRRHHIAKVCFRRFGVANIICMLKCLPYIPFSILYNSRNFASKMEIVRNSDTPYSATCLPPLSKRLRITALYYREGQKSCLTIIRDVDYGIF